jgi:YggT family protein
VQGISSTLQLYQAALIARLVLTWFPNRPQFLEEPLGTICDPYLNLFRGLIPPLGSIDFSPILAFVALDLLTNSAGSLSCELPSEYRQQQRKRQRQHKRHEKSVASGAKGGVEQEKGK